MTMEPKFFYSNAVELALSPYDLSLRFLRNEAPVGAADGAEVSGTAADACVVTMSPQHGKVLLMALFKSVGEYERQFGRLGLPAELQAQYDAAFGT